MAQLLLLLPLLLLLFFLLFECQFLRFGVPLVLNIVIIPILNIILSIISIRYLDSNGHSTATLALDQGNSLLMLLQILFIRQAMPHIPLQHQIPEH